jgi:hypothetical protein
MKFKWYYLIWPAIKAKLKLCWWAIRYRGKKNIPKWKYFQLVADGLEQTAEKIKQSDEEKK